MIHLDLEITTAWDEMRTSIFVNNGATTLQLRTYQINNFPPLKHKKQPDNSVDTMRVPSDDIRARGESQKQHSAVLEQASHPRDRLQVGEGVKRIAVPAQTVMLH